MRGVAVLLSTRARGQRSASAVHERNPDAELEAPVLPYAFAAGLLATIVGGLVSLFVPGRGFLLVWGLVSIAAACAAGWGADRMRSTAQRTLTRLVRTD